MKIVVCMYALLATMQPPPHWGRTFGGEVNRVHRGNQLCLRYFHVYGRHPGGTRGVVAWAGKRHPRCRYSISDSKVILGQFTREVAEFRPSRRHCLGGYR